jgi:hypothetical protein
MNNNFNNLYESGRCISFRSHRRYFCSIGAAVGMPFLKKLGQIYNKMGRFGLLGRRLGGAAGKTSPLVRP